MLTPEMLLWMDLVTDALTALVLGANPMAEAEGSAHRPVDENVVTVRMLSSPSTRR